MTFWPDEMYGCVSFRVMNFCYCYICNAQSLLGEEGAIRNEEAVARMVAPINECLTEAAWGRATWRDVCRCIVDVMPDVVPFIRNVDLPRRVINTMFVEGIEPEHIASYLEHYVTIDPWLKAMEEVSHGRVCTTEKNHPSANLSNSEFYNDWLSHQDNLKAATGIRIDIDPRNSVIVCLHYPVRHAPVLDRTATAVLNRVKPALINAVRSAAMLRSGLEQSTWLGSLLEHIGDSALLVDARLRICEANSRAIGAMEHGEIYSGAGNILMLRDPAAQRWLEEKTCEVLAGKGMSEAVATFITDNQVYRISMTRPLDHGGPDGLLVHPRSHVLVMIKSLTSGLLHLDGEALRLAYGLTPAEIRLCETLVNGCSLKESAYRLQISEGTVRQRAKAVFSKTGARRQGELIARIMHFSAA